MTIESQRPDLSSIQMLRGIAALMVVALHVDVQLARLGYIPLGLAWGNTGVDIFFVISGFIMWYSTRRRPIGAGEFIRHRLIRIVPLYWAVTAAMLVVLLAAPSLVQSARFDTWHIIASFLFLPARHPMFGEYWPLVVPGWSLNIEMVFYALFAVALAISAGSLRRRLWLTMGLVAGFWAISSFTQTAIPVFGFYATPRMLEFLVGIMIAILFLSGSLRPGRWWLAAFVAGFAGLIFGWQSILGHTLVVLACSGIIVLAAVMGPALALAPLRALGDASYALYLTHGIVLSAVGTGWSRAGLSGLPAVVFIGAMFVCAIAGAFATYQLFERPVTRRLRDFGAARPVPQPVPTEPSSKSLP